MHKETPGIVLEILGSCILVKAWCESQGQKFEVMKSHEKNSLLDTKRPLSMHSRFRPVDLVAELSIVGLLMFLGATMGSQIGRNIRCSVSAIVGDTRRRKHLQGILHAGKH